MKILITTGIYPPEIGGPAQYAKNLEDSLIKMGNSVSVLTYRLERKLPKGIRHLLFFFRTLPRLVGKDFVITLDTFSVGLPTVMACKLLGKKVLIRTGGDFLWEAYVERTGNMVLLRDFYTDESVVLNAKERMIMNMTKWLLRNSSKIIFSTKWQKDIWSKPYSISDEKTAIIENFYGEKESQDFKYESKEFIGSTRVLKWKNLKMLNSVFKELEGVDSSISLNTKNYRYNYFMEAMKKSYAVILVSIGDISPNMILDAIRLGKPFICTKENGLNDRIKDIGIFVDPLNKEEIKKAVLFLSDSNNYNEYLRKVKDFNFSHTYSEIAREFLDVYSSLKN